MYSTRLFSLLLLVVAIIAVAQASWLDNARINENAVARRQDTGNAGDDTANDADSSPTDEEPTAEPTDDPAPTPTDEGDDGNTGEETTSVPASSESTTAADPETTAPPEQSSSSKEQSSSSTTDPSSSSGQQESTSASEESSRTTDPPGSSSADEEEKNSKTTASPVVSTRVEVVIKTNDDGSKETMTNVDVTTNVPDLNADDSDDDGGMSDSTRNTIIGVVVGIGGAIVLGAIALVAWRIWGRRKRAEENDALMDYDHGHGGFGNNNGVEKTEPPSTAGGSTAASRSPFQQTLENYHQPGQVNASSNF